MTGQSGIDKFATTPAYEADSILDFRRNEAQQKLDSPSSLDIVHNPPRYKLNDLVEYADNRTYQVINPQKFGYTGDGSTDDTTSIVNSIAFAAGKAALIKVPYTSTGTKFSEQIEIPSNIILDFSNNTIQITGTLLSDADLPSIFKFTGNNSKVIKTKANTRSGQFFLEFSTSATNNTEESCEQLNSSGLLNLIKPEWGSTSCYKNNNRSLSYEGISCGFEKNDVRKTIKLTGISVNGSGAKILAIRNFPTFANIDYVKVLITSGNKNYDFKIFEDGTYSSLWTKMAQTSDVYESLNLPYYNKSANDILYCYLVNHDAGAIVVDFEIYFTPIKYTNYLWAYTNKHDLIRPHGSSAGTPYYDGTYKCTKDSIPSVEFRSNTNEDPGVTYVDTAIPARDVTTYRPLITIPGISGKTQDKSHSSLKYYFNYPAARAVIEKPTHFVFNPSNISKDFAGTILYGWLSQNPDYASSYLKAVWNVEDLLSFSFTAPMAAGGAVEIPLDPKAYQLASKYSISTSHDFFYFILTTSDTAKAFDWGSTLNFYAHFLRKE